MEPVVTLQLQTCLTDRLLVHDLSLSKKVRRMAEAPKSVRGYQSGNSSS